MAKNNNNWISKQLIFALANAYNKSENDITKEYLQTLKEIDLSGRGIKNLKGIEYANNVVSINLSSNKIHDASYLAKLVKLEKLDLNENKIEDVSFLKNLISLRSVGLCSNNISYIPNLTNLKYLELINISNNKIKNLSFISNLKIKNIKIIASDQCILLHPVSITYGEDYIFEPNILWDEYTPIFCDNIQITGEYKSILTDERPSLLYSISKIIIKNILSDCIVKVDFYHEVPFFKSGILSGTLIQPIIVELTNSRFNTSILKKNKKLGSIYGKLILESEISDKINLKEDNFINNKVITIIDPEGNKSHSITNKNGEFEFINLTEGRYTLLFPFINGYKYVSPSLYICNIEEGEFLEVNSFITDN